MKRAIAIAIPVFAAAMTCSAWAQQAPAPEPVLNVTIDPKRVVVGQRTTLRVDVLAPNYTTSPPELPGFQVRNAVTRQLQSVNLSEQRDGINYAGVRFEFAIYPQEPGAFAISDQKVKVKYAAEPPSVREELLSLPRVSFDAFIPDGATDLDPYVAASSLRIEQSVQRSSEQLKVGDSITRTVTIQADETPAMLLPPVIFPAVDGLAVYPGQPSLQDKTEGRTDALAATRTDSATYILQRSGDFVLPAVNARWWNADTEQIETAHLDAVTLQVAANPAAEARGSAPPARSNWIVIFDFIADHRVAAIFALSGLVALAWLIPRAGRAIANLYRRHRASYLHSEQFYFDQLRHAARLGDANASYFALLAWLQRFGPSSTIDTLKVAARDPALVQEVTSLEAQLFAGQPNGAGWSPHRFIRHIGSARRSLRKRSVQQETHTALPSRLNPGSNHIPPRRQWGKPAR